MRSENFMAMINNDDDLQQEATLAVLRWMRSHCNEWAIRDTILRSMQTQFASLDEDKARQICTEYIEGIEAGTVSVADVWDYAQKYVMHTQWFRRKIGESTMELELKPRFTEAIEAHGVKGFESKRWRKFFKTWKAMEKWCDDNNAEVHGTRECSDSDMVTFREPRSWKTEADQRRSDKPLKAHADVVDKYEEIRDMQEALNQQMLAIQAVVKEKGNMADALAAEIMKFAEEYENQTIRTKKVVAKLTETPATKSKGVGWKKYIDWSLGKFMTISAELHKEASEFLEATKQILPAKKYLDTQKVESLTEGAEDFIAGLAAKLARTAKKIDDLEAVVKKID